jgi:hypothetical chaperone protein
MQQMRSHLPVVGIDFGTTNSSVTLATEDGRVQLASFSSLGEDTFSFRSVQIDRSSGRETLLGVTMR